MSYGMPGSYDSPVNIPVYGYGSYYHRDKGFSLKTLLQHIYRFVVSNEWFNVIFALITLGIAVYSVQSAHWVSEQPPLLLILTLSVISASILVRLKIPRTAKLVSFAVLLVLVLWWQASRSLHGQSIFQALASRPNENTIHFGLFLMFATWLIGAISTWSILQKKNAWLPAGLGALVVILNLSNLSPLAYRILPVYLAVALILIGITHLSQVRDSLSAKGGKYPGRTTRYFLVSALIITVAASLFSWFVPARAVEQVGFDASGRMIAGIQKNWFNIFASVPGKWSTIRSEDLKTLSFSSPIDKRTVVLFVITAKQPSYWRIERYPEYDPSGWSSDGAKGDNTLNPGARVEAEYNPASRVEISFTVETFSKTDSLLVTGEFISADIPVRLATTASDIMSVNTPRLLQPQQTYTVTTSVSTATPEQLADAGTVYPEWITGTYLQLPDSISERVRALAAQLTDNAATPYGKAVAVQKYLNTIKYNRDAKSPSRLGEETDSFLFIQKEGVCTDYATAMVVMLRSVGIPARLATGYVPGEHNQTAGTFTVRGKDYHAWPEVYFPDYGWIEFEPTPGSIADAGITVSGGNDPYDYYDLYPPGYYDSGSDPGIAVPSTPATPKGNYVFLIVTTVILGLAFGSIAWIFFGRIYRNFRHPPDAVSVYAKMCRWAAFGGAPPIITETPLEYCRRLTAVFPGGAQAITSIAAIYTESLFSRKKDIDENNLSRLQRSWSDLYPVFIKSRLPWRR